MGGKWYEKSSETLQVAEKAMRVAAQMAALGKKMHDGAWMSGEDIQRTALVAAPAAGAFMAYELCAARRGGGRA